MHKRPILYITIMTLAALLAGICPGLVASASSQEIPSHTITIEFDKDGYFAGETVHFDVQLIKDQEPVALDALEVEAVLLHGEHGEKALPLKEHEDSRGTFSCVPEASEENPVIEVTVYRDNRQGRTELLLARKEESLNDIARLRNSRWFLFWKRGEIDGEIDQLEKMVAEIESAVDQLNAPLAKASKSIVVLSSPTILLDTIAEETIKKPEMMVLSLDDADSFPDTVESFSSGHGDDSRVEEIYGDQELEKAEEMVPEKPRASGQPNVVKKLSQERAVPAPPGKQEKIIPKEKISKGEDAKNSATPSVSAPPVVYVYVPSLYSKVKDPIPPVTSPGYKEDGTVTGEEARETLGIPIDKTPPEIIPDSSAGVSMIDENTVAIMGVFSSDTVAVCGDGTQNGQEVCDDGTQNGSPNHCNAQCAGTTRAVCGNGIKEANETCDDGNKIFEDGCSLSCVKEICGDGVVQAGMGEACEGDGTKGCQTGGYSGVQSCAVDCKYGACVPSEYCGDGRVQAVAGEACDDDNKTSGDGCSSTCKVEICGDGTVQAGLGEQCDDGNATTGDGCNANCKDEFCGDGVKNKTEICDEGTNNGSPNHCNAQCTGTTGAICGNSIKEAGEACDDSNRISGDGCSSACVVERCGDGIKNGQEVCDDGTQNGSPNKCNAQCTGITTGVCGNNIEETGEACDDGNVNPQDGCSALCVKEVCGDNIVHAGLGEECEGNSTQDCTIDGYAGEKMCGTDCKFSACAPMEFCGDGIKNGTEACDAGINNGSPNHCNAQCTGTTVAICGNNAKETGEACDDGNKTSGDGCSSACKVETCSDRVVQAGLGEQCDDGNTAAGDGCNAACKDEFCGDKVVQSAMEVCDSNSRGCTTTAGYTGSQSCNAQCIGFNACVSGLFCGDEIINGKEICDDGVDNGTPNHCNTQCTGTTAAICGNHVKETGEACDDGNKTSGDGCSSTCVVERCGDGIIQTGLGEACEGNSTKNCTAGGYAGVQTCVANTCTYGSCALTESCGDGIKNGNETCDDGNKISGDGCSALCVKEICGDGIVQTGLGEVCEGNSTKGCVAGGYNGVQSCTTNCTYGGCTATESCGDGIKNGTEVCDEGTNNGTPNHCNAQCTGITAAICGNSIKEAGEACDDSNRTSGDGCSSTCVVERCGDGIKNGTEVCDEGTSNGAPNHCNAQCTGITTGVCGNNAKETGEACDDGNKISGDGCSSTCVIESCGDGIIQAGLGEVCEGNSTKDCTVGGYAGVQTCATNCTYGICVVAQFCGDGIKNGPEMCDEGTNNGTPNHCNAQCSGITQGACGNNVKEAGEACDDGNKISGDGCSSSCVVERCGDGIVQTGLGEVCEGNSTKGCVVGGYNGVQSCATNCTYGGCTATESCGDGIKNGTEVCDEGTNNGSPNHCNAQCSGITQGVCGNNAKETGEACDDGNKISGDGCSSTCKVESCGDGIIQTGLGEACEGNSTKNCTAGGYAGVQTCTTNCTYGACVAAQSCGDGVKNGPEVCDEGTNNGTPNHCNAQCTGTTAAICGNSIKEAGEGCDDGNKISGDGCSASCVKEYCGDGVVQVGLGEICEGNSIRSCVAGGYHGVQSCAAGCIYEACSLSEFCGDGVVQTVAGEVCDDGNKTSGDGCSVTCKPESCGDGIVQAESGEQCDDGNKTAGDGCNAGCKNEYCGDGVVQAGLDELCDGSAQSCTGPGGYPGARTCDIFCAGFDNCVTVFFCGDGICTNPPETTVSCPSDCPAVCGNGIAESSEECDDRNTTSGDGCSATCKLEICGDGIVQTGHGEQCDDGNTTNGDGCSSTCQREQVADTTPPSVPAGLTATAASSTQISLSWTASTDPSTGSGQVSGVAGYKIYRNGALVTSHQSQITSYSDTGLHPLTTYTYAISAYDAAGNASSQSSPVQATTKAQSTGNTYYVSPPTDSVHPGNDATGTGTFDKRWATPQKCINMIPQPLTEPYTCIIGDGVYTDTVNYNNGYGGFVININKDGTASNWITIKAENLHQAILDGGSTHETLVASAWNNYSGNIKWANVAAGKQINYVGFGERCPEDVGNLSSATVTSATAIGKNWTPGQWASGYVLRGYGGSRPIWTITGNTSNTLTFNANGTTVPSTASSTNGFRILKANDSDGNPGGNCRLSGSNGLPANQARDQSTQRKSSLAEMISSNAQDDWLYDSGENKLYFNNPSWQTNSFITDDGNKTGISCSGCSYVIIEGFDIKNMNNGGTDEGAGQFVKLKKNIIHDIGRHYVSCNHPGIAYGRDGSGSHGAGAHDIVYEQNIYHTIGRLWGGCPGTNADYALDHGIYPDYTYNVDIINNVFYNINAGDHLSLTGRRPKDPITGQEITCLNLYVDGCARNINVLNNIFHGNNTAQTGATTGHIGFSWDVGNQDPSLVLPNDLSNTTSTMGMLVMNNISIDSGRHFISNDTQHGANWSPTYGDFYVYNNLIYNSSGGQPALFEYDPTSSPNWSVGENIIGQDPKVADIASRNFSLQSNSPAINAGLAYSGRTYDFKSNSIIGLPDLGAYEYSGSSGQAGRLFEVDNTWYQPIPQNPVTVPDSDKYVNGIIHADNGGTRASLGTGEYSIPIWQADANTPYTTVIINAQDYVFLNATGHRTEAQTTDGTPFALMANTSDYLYIGDVKNKNSVIFKLAALGAGYKFSVEYSKGSGAWGTVTGLNDGTSGFSASTCTTDCRLNFTQPGDWATDTVNGISGGRYWLRIKTTSAPTKVAAAHFMAYGDYDGEATLRGWNIVPIPDGAKGAGQDDRYCPGATKSGFDGQLAVLSADGKWIWEFNQASKCPTGDNVWHANAVRKRARTAAAAAEELYVGDGSGVGAVASLEGGNYTQYDRMGGITACSASAATHSLITKKDYDSGVIQHALGFIYSGAGPMTRHYGYSPCLDDYAKGTKSDIDANTKYMSIGSRIQLDPNYDCVGNIPDTNAGYKMSRMVCEALKTYGAIFYDIGDSNSKGFEAESIYGKPTNIWAGLLPTSTLLPASVWTSKNLRIVEPVCSDSRVCLNNPGKVDPDTTPPTVSITAPSDNAAVSGAITISANASDNVGVTGVQFKLDGSNLGAEDTIAPYSVSWNSLTAPNGSHTLTATARDTAGNIATSSPIAVTVNNIVTQVNSILTNPGFESGTSPWVFYTNGAGTFNADAAGDASAHAGHVVISQAGTNVQLYQADLALAPNASYRLTFKAYSNTGHDMSISLQKHGSPYTAYGLSGRVFDLTGSWSQFSVQFTTTGFPNAVDDGRLMFWLASYAAGADEYFIDDVVLEKVASIPDTTPPSVPAGLTATAVSSSQINLSWSASTDPSTGSGQVSGVAGYRVFRNGIQVATSSTASYSNTGLSPNTTYTYTVAAYDAAGNESGNSGSVTATTFATQVSGATYYIAATGGDDTKSGTQSAPWATFAKAWSTMLPGDTLILKDGTYYQQLKPAISGTPAAPITIRSENDGEAIIDGQYARLPCYFTGTPDATRDRTDIVVEGIQCKNSSGEVVIISHAQRITLRRVSAYNANVGTDASPKNVHVFAVHYANDILLEDTAASGPGRKMYDSLETQRVTFRRCWGRWVHYPAVAGSPNDILNPYGADDTLIENCVGTMDPSSSKVVQGMGVWAHYYNDSADRNEFYGNIVHGLSSWAYYDSSAQHRTEGNRFIDNVAINAPYGFFQRGDADLRVEKMTLTGITNQMFTVQAQSDYEGYPKDSDYEINGDVRNSVFLGGNSGFSVNNSNFPIRSFTHKYNNLYDIQSNFYGTTAGTGEQCAPSPIQCASPAINPNFDTARYGKGAYLMRSAALKGKGEAGGDIGAEVLYRYQNGVLTDIPLWPWPMEERILRETGVSVTWESQGGLWKTLDGVYSTDTTLPSVPDNLAATAISSSQINLSWSASTDLSTGSGQVSGVTGYKIYRNGVLVTSHQSLVTSYSDTGLQPSTTYTYAVSAYDAAGNASSQSSPVQATTKAESTGASYYVSPIGSDTNSGTQTLPWKTIQKAVDSAKPGDTVYVKAGTYYEKVKISQSGLAGQPIIFEGERGPDGKWLAVIDGSDPTSGWVPAPEIGAGVYKTTKIYYNPYAMIADGDKNIARIHDRNMTDNEFMDTWISWQNLMKTPKDRTVERLCYDKSVFQVVQFWDGVEAYFGYLNGTTYIRFRNGDDPNTRNVRSAPGPNGCFNCWPMGAAVRIEDKSHVHIKNFLIRGAQWGITMKGALAANNLIEENHIMNGLGRVQIALGAHDNVVRNNKMELNQLGFEKYPPGADNTGATCDPAKYSDPYSIGVRSGFYLIFKLMIGASVDQKADSGVALRFAGMNNEVMGNDIFNGAVGIDISDTTNTRIHHNKIHNMAVQGIIILERVKNLQIYDNLLYDSDINIRPMSMEKGDRLVYIYRNRIYNPHLLGAENFFFHFWPKSQAPSTYPEFYVYHNSIVGGNMALGIGDAVPAGGMPKARFINNIFSSLRSYTGWLEPEFYTKSSMIGVFDYNWVGGISPANVPAWFGGKNIKAQDQYMWDDAVMPDFRLPANSPAIDAGIDLSKPFVINGVSYDPLPGMNSGYFTGTAPDLGAYEYQGQIIPDTTPPSVPAGLTATAVSSSQINLSWSASTDNVGVTGYKIYRNGVLVTSHPSPVTSYSDTGLQPSTTYAYAVSAYDAAGNDSGQSTPASATTKPPTDVTPGNILANPGFESGTSPWVFYTNGAGTFDADTAGEASAFAGHVSITTAGTNVQLYQADLALAPNASYRLTFKAYSNTGHDISVSLQKHGSPYTAYGLSGRVFDLTTSWSQFSVQFTTAGFPNAVDDGRLMFWLASYAAGADEYFIDDVVLEKIVSADQEDTTPPSVPAGLTATAVSSSQINLSWTASTDIVGVTGYRIFRNDIQVATSATASYPNNTGLSPNTTYTYTVVAYDAAGNESVQSTPPIQATTKAQSAGNTYYVSPDGNDGNAGSSSAPFKTIQKAADLVNPGDTVIVKDGVYKLQTFSRYSDTYKAIVYLNRGGAPDKRIVFKSQNKWGAKLDGENNTAKYGFLTTVNANYVSVEDFEFYGIESAALFNGGGGVLFRGNKVRDIARRQISCSEPTVDYGRMGIFSEKEAGADRGNLALADFPNLWIDRNIFYNIGRLPGGCPTGSGGYQDWNRDHAIYANTNYLTITNNVIYDEIGQQYTITGAWGQHHVTVVGNTLYGKTDNKLAYSIKYIQVATNAKDYYIADNIFYMPDNQGPESGPVVMYNWDAGTGSASTIKIFNNLIFGNNVSTPVQYWRSDTYGHDWIASGNLFNQDPEFVYFDKTGFDSQNFHLQPGSPAINAGVDISAYTTVDHEGVSRPQSSAWDLGAYEYSGSSGQAGRLFEVDNTWYQPIPQNPVTVPDSDKYVNGIIHADNGGTRASLGTGEYSIPIWQAEANTPYTTVIIDAQDFVFLNATSHRTEAQTTGGTPFALMANTSDYLYVGTVIWKNVVYFKLQTPGEGYTLSVDYCTNSTCSTWSAVSNLVDDTSGFNSATCDNAVSNSAWACKISFDEPSNETKGTVNGISGRYWLRIKTTSTPTTLAKAYFIAFGNIDGEATLRGWNIVPIPDGAKGAGQDTRSCPYYPDTGGTFDGQLAVLSADGKWIWEFYQARKCDESTLPEKYKTDPVALSWHANTVRKRARTAVAAAEELYVGDGSGVGALAGLEGGNYTQYDYMGSITACSASAATHSIITKKDYDSGVIQHALGFIYSGAGPMTRHYGYYPCLKDYATGTKSDIDGNTKYMSFGSRVQLDPNYDCVANIPDTNTGYKMSRMVCEALKTYGAIFYDIGDSNSKGFEAESIYGKPTNIWAGLLPTSTLLPASVWTSENLRIVEPVCSDSRVCPNNPGKVEPDTTPPIVSITAPSDSDAVSGAITISANASDDDSGIAGVQFKLDGVNLQTEDISFPYSINWNTTQVSNGSHALTATARDTAGNTATSSSIAVTVNNIVTQVNSILTNPGFESGTGPWVFHTNGAGEFNDSAAGEASAHAGHVSIATAGTNVQLYQADLALAPNASYRLTFKAYSNTGHDISVSLQKHGSPYTAYGLSGRVFDLTGSWSRFSVQFKTAGFSTAVNDGRLMFWLASYAAGADEYFIDDVVLEKIVSADPGDTTPPSVPAGLTATAVSSSQINLSWSASTDPSTGSGQASGVAGYRVFRNGIQVATSTTASYSNTGLSPNTTYTYTVAAYDAAGNESGQSAPASAATLSTGTVSADINTLQSRLVSEYASGSTANTATYLAAQQSDGHWTDINYAVQRVGGSWAPLEHLKRLRVMAVAYVRTGTYYHSVAVLGGITNGLTYWFAAKPDPGDYYFKRIGQQLVLGPILIIMEPYLSSTLVSSGASHMLDPGGEGSNLVDTASETIWRGCLNESLADIQKGLNAIKNELTVVAGEGGLQADFSFHQHGPLLYNGGYGRVFTDSLSFWASMTRGLAFAFEPARLADLSGMLLDGSQWMIRRGSWDHVAFGRGIALPYMVGSSALETSLNRLIALGAARKAEFQALLSHIQGGNDGALTGNKHFWNSDYHVHRRIDYHVSVRLTSTRTVGTEFDSGENRWAFYLPFGMTTILRAGDEYKNIYPAWDWARIPGVTSPHRLPPPTLQSGYRGTTTFVGAASDGTYGAVGFDLKLDGVTGRKAWFFFDKEFVALGAGITGGGGIPVFTSLNQTRLSGGVQVSYDGATGSAVAKGQRTLNSPKWVHHDGVGYVFPVSGNVELKADAQTGNWSSIGVSSGSVTMDVFSLWFDHGANPTNAQYEYRVVPGIDSGAMATYVGNAHVRTIRNTPDLQAVRNDDLKVAGLVFYTAGEVEIRDGLTVRVDRPCVVLVKESVGQTAVTVADPTGLAPDVTVTLLYAGGISQPLVFTLPTGTAKGRSVTQIP